MNSTIIKLIKLQLDNEFEIFRSKNVKKLVLNVFKVLLTVGLIFAVLMYFLNTFKKLGFLIDERLLGMMLMVCQAITLVFAIFRIKNKLYESKDNEFLIVLPCNGNQLFFSKIIMIYIEEVFISSMYTAPILLSIGLVGEFVWWYFALMPLLLIILPILPMAIASLLSIPLVFITKVINRRVVVSLLITLGLFAVLIIFYTRIITAFTRDFGMANLAQQIKTISRINAYINDWSKSSILFYPLAQSFCNTAYFSSFLMYLFLGLISCTVTIFIIKPFYFKAMQTSMESQVSILGKKNAFKSEKPFKSMLCKEFYSIIRSRSYTIQFLLFTFLMPVIVTCYDMFILNISVSQVGSIMVLGSHILTFAIVAMLSNLMSATTISREGASFYYMKITPNNYYTQISAKLLINIILSTVAIVVTTCISFIYFAWYNALLSGLAVWIACVGHACYSLDLDVKEPNLKWYGFGEMNTVSKNATSSMIVGLAVAFIMGFFVMFTAGLSPLVSWLMLFVGVIAFTLRKLYILGVRIGYKFNKLEM